MSKIIVRKIQKGKWEDYCTGLKSKNKIKQLFEEFMPNASADAITNCLRTTRNELSIWIVEEDRINDALLAMSTGSEMNDVSSIEYISFNPSEFKKNGLSYKQSSSDANTAVVSLKDNHYDIDNLDYKKLGIIQKMIVRKIIKGDSVRVTKAKLFSIIEDAIDAGVIDYSSLSESYITKLKQKYPNKNIPSPVTQE